MVRDRAFNAGFRTRRTRYLDQLATSPTDTLSQAPYSAFGKEAVNAAAPGAAREIDLMSGLAPQGLAGCLRRAPEYRSTFHDCSVATAFIPLGSAAQISLGAW